MEEAPWTGLEVLDERASLSRRSAGRVDRRGSAAVAERFRESANERDRSAAVVSGLLVTSPMSRPGET
jgi:hypothetical protein